MQRHHHSSAKKPLKQKPANHQRHNPELLQTARARQAVQTSDYQPDFTPSTPYVRPYRGRRRGLSKAQVIGVVSLSLIAGAALVDAYGKINDQPVADKTPKKQRPKIKDESPKDAPKAKEQAAIKAEVTQRVCTDKSVAAFNKPNITLGMNTQGRIVPKVCLSEDTATCRVQSEIKAVFDADETSYRTNLHKLINAREAGFKVHKKWQATMMESAMPASTELADHEVITFRNALETLDRLKELQGQTAVMEKLGGGNCGEQARAAIRSLLVEKWTYGLPLKIQMVSMRTPLTKNAINDHTYLLLDSNISDVSIENNPKQVKAQFNAISKGMICDPWNSGYYADFKTDDSRFYNNANWDSLKVVTYENLDFAKIKTLPKAARKLICEALSDLGFELSDAQAACRLFKKPAKVSQQPVAQSKLKLDL